MRESELTGRDIVFSASIAVIVALLVGLILLLNRPNTEPVEEVSTPCDSMYREGQKDAYKEVLRILREEEIVHVPLRRFRDTVYQLRIDTVYIYNKIPKI